MSSGNITIGAKRRLVVSTHPNIGSSSSPSNPTGFDLLERMQVNIPQLVQPYRDSSFLLTPPYSVIGDLRFSINVRRLPDQVLQFPDQVPQLLDPPAPPAPPAIPLAPIALNNVYYAPPPPPPYVNEANMIPMRRYLEMMKMLITSLGSAEFIGVLARIEGSLQIVSPLLMCQEKSITDSLKSILFMIRNQSYLPPYPVQGALTSKNVKIALHALSVMLESPDMTKFREDLQKDIDFDIGLHKVSSKKLNAAFYYAIESIVM